MLRARGGPLMKKHLIRLFSLSAVISLIAAFLLSMPLVQRHNLRQTQAQLKSILLVLSSEPNHMLAEAPDTFSDRCAAALAGSGIDIRLTLLDANGCVIADSSSDASIGQSHSDRPEVQQALANQWGFDTRKSESTGISYSYAAYSAGGLIYRAAMPVANVWRSALLLSLYSLIGLLAGVVIALFLSRIWAARSAKPVADLTKIATQVAAGDFSQRVRPSGDFKELGNALNSVTQELSDTSDELRRSNDRLHTVLQSLDEGVIAIEDQKITLLTSRAERMLGKVPQGASTLPACGANYLYLQRVIAKAMQTQEEIVEEITVSSPSPRVLQAYAVHLGDAPNSALAVVRDVTKLHQLEVMRRDFVANVTHELKTPLTSIRGYVELLQDEHRDAKTRAKFYEIICIEADRLQRLIDDLLELSKIENSEPKAAENQKTDLEKIARESLERLAPMAQNHHITLSSELAPGLAIQADPERIIQLLTNLIQNAIKYNRPNGSVTVSTQAMRGMAVLRVQDTGIGIPEESLPRIFERFYRVDKGRSRELGGTGLGLSIVKHIVQLYGGDISVDSVLGQGTVFQVRFPLAQ